jgi:AraC-like DNA-binding protein
MQDQNGRKGSAMLMLPVPAFFALILAYLALRSFLSGGRLLLAAFLAACALQSLAVALAVGYGIGALHSVLPITAATIPPLAWLTFRSTLFRTVSWDEAWPHLAAPLFCLFCRIFAPATLDVVVALIFAGYGASLLLSLRATGDLPLARIDAGGLPGKLWRTLGWLLIASAFSDTLIGLAHASGNPLWADRIVSLFASLTILLLGVLSSFPEAAGEADAPTPIADPADAPRSAETALQDKEILEALDGLLRREKTYLDPGLTLLRLARRLHLPEKRISAAVNRATGGNVSRHINTWRIEHACNLMVAGHSVTSAMLASGFNTKSNFNREFLRVVGRNPRDWLTGQSQERQ